MGNAKGKNDWQFKKTQDMGNEKNKEDMGNAKGKKDGQFKKTKRYGQ